VLDAADTDASDHASTIAAPRGERALQAVRAAQARFWPTL
jgi:hypothetical protein